MRRTSRTAATGFTLLELAVVLVLVSLMAGFAIKVVPSKDCYAATRAQEREIQNAIETYVRANNKLPMPAGRALSPTNPLYGVGVTDADAKVTDGTIDRIGGATASDTTVLVGALPYVTLNLNGSYAADCWGNKFTYMVSEQLTGANYKNKDSAGRITVRTGSTSLTTPGPATLTSAAAYTVISHGQDALGASPRNFTGSKKYCNTEQANGAITRVDKENCDTANADVYSTEFNNGVGAPNFYDDLVVYANKTGYTGCDATTVTWSACSSAVAALANGATQALSYSSGGTTGSATATCNNGTVELSGTTCTAPATCAGQAVSWPTGCSGTSTDLALTGDTQSVTNTAVGKTGSVTVTCNSDGSLTQSSLVCTSTASCSSSYGWGAGCSGTPSPAITHGNSATITNSAGGYTGSVTVTCNNGSYTSPTGATCTALANCSGQTVSWNTNCSASSGTLLHGGSATLSNSASGYTGTVDVSCSNGTISKSNPTCTAVPPGDCLSQTVSWGTGCSVTAGALTHGATSPVTNTASGYTGTATASCNNGTTTASGTCNANCAAQTVPWNTNCSGSAGALNHGASSTISNTASGYNGSATVTCTNGTLSKTDLSCTSNAGSSCGGTHAGYTDCNGMIVADAFTCASTEIFDMYKNACGSGSINIGTSGCTTDPSCAARTPDCYEKGDANCATSGDSCGTYYYTDGSTEGDAAPKDWPNLFTPPTGWTFCSSCSAPDCTFTNPNTGTQQCLTDGTYRYFATNCETYTCCSGVLTSDVGACTMADAVGEATSCSAGSVCCQCALDPSNPWITDGACPASMGMGNPCGSVNMLHCTGGCVSQTVTWNTNCSATVADLTDGGTSSLSNVASGYTGAATATCTSGTVVLSGTSCAADGGGCTLGDCAYSDGGGTCCISNGVSFKTSGTNPCSRYRCDNGSLTYLGQTGVGCPDASSPVCDGGGGM